jgi:hypothetical protein
LFQGGRGKLGASHFFRHVQYVQSSGCLAFQNIAETTKSERIGGNFGTVGTSQPACPYVQDDSRPATPGNVAGTTEKKKGRKGPRSSQGVAIRVLKNAKRQPSCVWGRRGNDGKEKRPRTLQQVPTPECSTGLAWFCTCVRSPRVVDTQRSRRPRNAKIGPFSGF